MLTKKILQIDSVRNYVCDSITNKLVNTHYRGIFLAQHSLRKFIRLLRHEENSEKLMKASMLPWKERESIFLTYPKDYCRPVIRSDDSREFDLMNEGKRPLAIILAWTSAIERHMRLYSKIFEDEGYITLISICPIMVAFWHHDIMHEIAQKLVDTIEGNNLFDKPTIIQLFSNGGTMQYEFFMKALKRNRKCLNVKGVIFDSLPAKTTFRNYFKAVHIMRGGTSEAKSALMTASLFTGWRMRNFFRYIINRDFFVWDSWKYLKNEENLSPQHFIYSRADAVAPYQDIEEILEQRKLLGVKVTSTVYEDTPHIRHLQFEKLSYTKSVQDFAKKCLNSTTVYRKNEFFKSKL